MLDTFLLASLISTDDQRKVGQLVYFYSTQLANLMAMTLDWIKTTLIAYNRLSPFSKIWHVLIVPMGVSHVGLYNQGGGKMSRKKFRFVICFFIVLFLAAMSVTCRKIDRFSVTI